MFLISKAEVRVGDLTYNRNKPISLFRWSEKDIIKLFYLLKS